MASRCGRFEAHRKTSLYLHQRLKGFGEDVRLAHHAQVVGVAAIDGAFGVFAEHPFYFEWS